MNTIYQINKQSTHLGHGGFQWWASKLTHSAIPPWKRNRLQGRWSHTDTPPVAGFRNGDEKGIRWEPGRPLIAATASNPQEVVTTKKKAKRAPAGCDEGKRLKTVFKLRDSCWCCNLSWWPLRPTDLRDPTQLCGTVIFSAFPKAALGLHGEERPVVSPMPSGSRLLILFTRR